MRVKPRELKGGLQRVLTGLKIKGVHFRTCWPGWLA